MTSKFHSETKAKFKLGELSVKKQNEDLYDCLVKFQTQFDSTIAKLELIALREELTKLGYELKILQISRSDYKGVPEIKYNDNIKNEFGIELDDFPDMDDSEWEEIREELREGKSFSVGNKNYFIEYTLGDGACGLHALLGEKKSRQYAYPADNPNAAARAQFIKNLEQEIKTPSIKKLWIKWMVQFLKDHLNIPSTDTKIVFENASNEVEGLKTKLKKLDSEKEQQQKEQEECFSQAAQLEACKDALEKTLGILLDDFEVNPEKMNNKFRENLDDVLSVLEKTKGSVKAGKIVARLTDVVEKLKDIEKRRENLLKQFVQKTEIWNAYLKGIARSDYYFSNQEIEIAAHLFKKRIVIYGHKYLSEVQEPIEGGDPDQPKVVIFHKGNHFSRCTRLKSEE